MNPEDYDFIKKAFLRAQQIKAGLDAGFIKEEDFVQARDSFLHSLDFALVGGASAGGLGPQGSGGVPSPRVAPIPVAPPPVNIRAAPPPMNRAATQARDSPTAAQAAAPPPPPAPQVPRLSHVSSAGSLAGGGTGTVPIPTDLPARSARTSTTASGKTSMSGISVNEQCVAIFNQIKTRSAYKWVTYKVNDAGNEVVVDQLGASDSSYEQFAAILPESNCRYAVYDYAYLNADTQQTINKLVFVHWAPDSAAIKAKMMYASTKDFLKSYLDGLGAELQATDVKELAEHEMRERVHQAITRK